MFHLTPQEKQAVTALLVVCLLGSIIHFALSKDVAALRWIKDSQELSKPFAPDINTANAEDLDRLPGIGPKTAWNIVNYRQAHGPFAQIDDLRKVKGVTKRVFAKILPLYTTGSAHDKHP